LHLDFATADVILTPDRHHVLLEVNGPSYYDSVEDATGPPLRLTAVGILVAGGLPKDLNQLTIDGP
jgi:hypothetical protein